jgi:hypothetical protein
LPNHQIKVGLNTIIPQVVSIDGKGVDVRGISDLGVAHNMIFTIQCISTNSSADTMTKQVEVSLSNGREPLEESIFKRL